MKIEDIDSKTSDMILEMINANSECSKEHNACYDVWTDGSMILTESEDTYKTLVKAFDILGLSFSTGEPDNNDPEEIIETYYIDFA